LTIFIYSIQLFEKSLDLEWDLEDYLAFSVKYWNIRDVNAAVLDKAADVLPLIRIDGSLIDDIIFSLNFIVWLTWLQIYILNAEYRYYSY
jgi:hypothetical protein